MTKLFEWTSRRQELDYLRELCLRQAQQIRELQNPTSSTYVTKKRYVTGVQWDGEQETYDHLKHVVFGNAHAPLLHNKNNVLVIQNIGEQPIEAKTGSWIAYDLDAHYATVCSTKIFLRNYRLINIADRKA